MLIWISFFRMFPSVAQSFKALFFAVYCIGLVIFLQAQVPDIDVLEKRLNQPFDGRNQASEAVWENILKENPGSQETIIHALEKTEAGQKNPTKIILLKTRFSRKHDLLFDGKGWIFWGNEAVKRAVSANDNYLLEDACGLLGDGYLWLTRKDTALFYLLKALEIGETMGYEPGVMARRKVAASNALYQTHNYNECLEFCRTAIPFADQFDLISRITLFNNLGLSYLRTGKPDSAIPYFQEAVRAALAGKSGVWAGIATGNIGDALHQAGNPEAAIPYWQTDVDSCMAYGEWPNAGLSLAYMAEQKFLKTGQKDIIKTLQWAHQVNAADPVNLVRILAIQARVNRALQQHDSADYFWARHYALADSLNRGIEKGNFNMVQLRLQYERFTQNYQLLQKEKNALENRRNLMAVALLSLLVIGGLVYNRQRLRLKLEKQDKELAEAVTRHAQQQLETFTGLLIEKNEQIELLNASLSKQQTANHDELVHQTLLTDYDWNRFRELFEKSHPGYFERLKIAAPGITASEMRLAALIKLNLDNKQMAGMQGISVSSVRGNKTRLRQKLTSSQDTELEEFLRAL